jgi:hypothetical protein
VNKLAEQNIEEQQRQALPQWYHMWLRLRRVTYTLHPGMTVQDAAAEAYRHGDDVAKLVIWTVCECETECDAETAIESLVEELRSIVRS